MSHFTVLVIGGNVEEKLVPYDENLEVEPYVKYTKGEVIVARQNLVMEKAEYKKYGEMSIEEFIETWYGLESDEHGNAVTTYNPKSRWDWYQIGGRWQGMLKLKSGNEIKHPELILQGEKSFLDKEPYKAGWTDQACFGDVDWKGMRDANDIQQLEKDWEDAISGKDDRFLYKPGYYLERYKTKEKYIESQTRFSTYAVITEDGEWNEKAKMGWFGMTAASPEEEYDWDEAFWDTFMKDLKEDTLLTIVDCHI